MSDHPQYAMWKARYEAEQAAAQERDARRASREVQQADWKRAWEEYKARRREGRALGKLPRWWDVQAWLQVLFGKSRPYR